MKRSFYKMAYIILVWFAGWHCNKQFDEPPPYKGPDIHATLNIRQLRAMHFTGGFEKIFEEYTVEGVVTANDSSDNFYKCITIQDSTAGIMIRLDGTGLYHQYPVGRKIFVKLKGLWLGDYSGMVQLGAGVDRSDPVYPDLIGIPQTLFDRHLVKASFNNTVTPMVTSIEGLNDSLQSCLVIIKDVEIAVADTGRPYADASNRVSLNRTIQSCSGNRAYIRSSGFAGFANIKTPRGNGSITGIYSIFRSDRQLLIRDTADVQLHGLRCTGKGAKLLFAEDFESVKTQTDLQAKGWRNMAETGSRIYESKLFSGNRYLEIGAFATGQSSVVAWLISPIINLSNSSDELLRFSTKDAFDNGAVLQVLVSTNYDGGNTPWKAKWTTLKTVVAKGSVNTVAANWVLSGDVKLDNFTGNLYIAFRYEGTDPVNALEKRTTTFQLDNISVFGN